MVLDMSELISMASMFDTTGTMDQDQMIQQMRDSMGALQLDNAYNDLAGIDNANVEVSDEGVITIAFDFDNVESLNASFKALQDKTAEMSEGSMDMMPTDLLGGGEQMFKREGKVIVHSMNSEGGLGEGLMGGGEGEDMDMFSSMIDYTIDFSFDRRVKSVDVEGLDIIEKGDKIVKTRVDFAKMMKDGKYSIKVKTK